MPEFIDIERDGRVLKITLNRPKLLNALHPPAHHELGKVFDDFESDPELWVAVITGTGERAFCAGNDLKFQAANERLSMPESGFAGLTNRVSNHKPIIAAVNGLAMGGGFEIVLACDLVIAAEDAIFALPEPKVGLAAIAGGLHRLPRQIPLKHALGMILTGRRVPAAEGKELGFVNEVVPRADLMQEVQRWVDMILECAPLSIRASKQSVMGGLDIASLTDAMNAPFDQLRAMVKSQDFREGPQAFVEKRKPNWQGK